MTNAQTTDPELFSGASARTAGRVPEYAELTKKKLLALGQSDKQAEAARLQILERFGK